MRALRASPDLILLTRLPEDEVVEASDSLLALLGRARDEVVHHSAGETGLTALRGEVPTSARPGDPREVVLDRASGDRIVLRISSVSFDHEGARYVLTIGRDVTEEVRLSRELRRSEERFRGIFERAREGLFRTDLDGNIVAANPALARIAGYASVEELLARAPNVRDICPDPDRRALLLRELAARGAVEDFEVRLRRPDGGQPWLSLSVHEVRDGAGRLLAREGFAMDVTDRKVLELERTRLASEIVRALEAERATIAEAVHDDPVQKMTAVGLRLGMLRAALAGTEHEAAAARLAEDVQLAIGRLRRLIFDLHPPVLASGGLVEALRVLVRTMAEDRPFEVELRGTLDREPPPEVAVVLYRVAREALTNVAKHARASRVSVAVGSVDGVVRVEVRDDGVGFDPSTAGRPRPWHLGLEAMRERMRLIGGRFEIRSAPGAGTTVAFEAPTDAGG
ncbi:MAG TPA: PAS domain S-box protein [Actinomycetota bacterium]|nr:PAS domain S-box protein [Actinomycetota bacterium]